MKKADIITEENWPLVDAAFDAALAAARELFAAKN